jgi:hypothetical protein
MQFFRNQPAGETFYRATAFKYLHAAVGLLTTFCCCMVLHPFSSSYLNFQFAFFSRTSSIAARYPILGMLLRNPFRRRWRGWYFSCTCSEPSRCKGDCCGKTFRSTCPASFEIFVEQRERDSYIIIYSHRIINCIVYIYTSIYDYIRVSYRSFIVLCLSGLVCFPNAGVSLRSIIATSLGTEQCSARLMVSEGKWKHSRSDSMFSCNVRNTRIERSHCVCPAFELPFSKTCLCLYLLILL